MIDEYDLGLLLGMSMLVHVEEDLIFCLITLHSLKFFTLLLYVFCKPNCIILDLSNFNEFASNKLNLLDDRCFD